MARHFTGEKHTRSERKKASGISLIVLLLCMGFVSGCRENYLAEKAFYKAGKLFSEARAQSSQTGLKESEGIEAALSAFEAVVEKFPSTPKAPESLIVISQIREEQGRFEEARASLDRLIQNYGGSKKKWEPEARFRMAQIYEEEGRWDEAEKAYWDLSEYFAMDPKGLHAPFYVVLHHRNQRDVGAQKKSYEKALAQYEKIVNTLGPIQASFQVRHYVALVHWAGGELEKAAGEWDALARQFSDSPQAPYWLLSSAEAWWESGKAEQADQAYATFFDRFGSHTLASKAKIRRGTLFLNRKQYAEARNLFKEVLDKQSADWSQDQVAEVKLLIGKSYQGEGQWSEAEAVYKEIESSHSETVSALEIPLLIARYHTVSDHPEQAARVLTEAIDRYQKLKLESPGSLSAYAQFFTNEAYAQMGDWQRVLDNVDEEFGKETENDKKGSWLLLKAYITANRLEEREQALDLYRKFLSEYPSHPLRHTAEDHIKALSQVAAGVEPPAFSS